MIVLVAVPTCLTSQWARGRLQSRLISLQYSRQRSIEGEYNWPIHCRHSNQCLLGDGRVGAGQMSSQEGSPVRLGHAGDVKLNYLSFTTAGDLAGDVGRDPSPTVGIRAADQTTMPRRTTEFSSARMSICREHSSVFLPIGIANPAWSWPSWVHLRSVPSPGAAHIIGPPNTEGRRLQPARLRKTAARACREEDCKGD